LVPAINNTIFLDVFIFFGCLVTNFLNISLLLNHLIIRGKTTDLFLQINLAKYLPEESHKADPAVPIVNTEEACCLIDPTRHPLIS